MSPRLTYRCLLSRGRRPACAALLLTGQTTCRACLWDSETLASEVARLPEAVKIMTGNFPRHSKAFFEWRVRTSRESLAQPNASILLYDDLAVAQHKLGDHKAAIETMMAKEKIKPGIYETYSNLGTFYIYTGDLPTALSWIDKALAINANAHFGREKYQKWLVEWVMQGKPYGIEGFGTYAREQSIKGKSPGNSALPGLNNQWNKEATAGVLGMMRFADYDNPILQEALGDILSAGEPKVDASHLAAMAYVQAGRKPMSDLEKKAVDRKLSVALNKAQWSQREAETELKKHVDQGNILTAAVTKDEAIWISEGKDVSVQFISKYYK